MDKLQSQEGVLVRGGEGAGGGGGRGSAGVGGESGGTAGTAGMHRRKSGLEPLKHFVSGWVFTDAARATAGVGGYVGKFCFEDRSVLLEPYTPSTS